MAAKEKKIMPPKLNKFMHPRNLYKTPPSFKKLATEYPEFRAHCVYDVAGKVHLDFKNPSALRALTTCLLHQDFGLQVKIPEDRLVPTLPLRLNYLLWLQDLLYLAARRRGGGGGGGDGGGGDSQEETCVIGADIGTGAACVYPLLGAAHFRWCMLGTETNPLSYSSALENVEQNGLSKQIALMKVDEKTILKGALDNPETLAQVSALRPRSGGGGGGGVWGSHSPVKIHGFPGTQQQAVEGPGGEKEGRNGHEHKEERMEVETQQEENKNGSTGKEAIRKEESQRDYIFDFVMTNPPFFSSEEEADTMAKSRKGRGEPSAAPTGSAHEKVTEGGEVEFIRQMVEESQLLQDRVRIFSTLIGTKAHVREVRRLVEAAKPTSCAFTEFCQGRTMRWGAAWTFASGVSLSEVRSKKDMATNKPIVLLLPRSLMSVYSVQAGWAKVHAWLRALKVKVEVFKTSKYFVSANIKAFKPTWLHQRRQRRQKERQRGQQQQQQQHHAEGTKGEEDKGSSSKRKTEEEREEGEERENKKARIATEGEMEMEELEMEGETGRQQMEGEEDLEEEEEDLEEEEGHEEEKPADKDGQEGMRPAWGDPQKPAKGGLRCILRCNFQVKQTGGLISVEAYYLGGSLGKDGLNQLVQYMRNQLTNPPV